MIWDGIVPLSTVGKPGASFFTLRDTHHFSPEDQFGTKCSQAGRFFISLNNSFGVAYILKVNKLAESTFQAKKIGGKSA